MTNQMLEALLHISINGPPVSEAQELVEAAVEAWSKAKKWRKLPPPTNLGAVTSGNLRSEAQAILVDSAVQTDLEGDVNDEVEEASVQAEVKLLLKPLNVQTTKQVRIQTILLLKVKANTKHSSIIWGNSALFCNNNTFWNYNANE